MKATGFGQKGRLCGEADIQKWTNHYLITALTQATFFSLIALYLCLAEKRDNSRRSGPWVAELALSSQHFV